MPKGRVNSTRRRAQKAREREEQSNLEYAAYLAALHPSEPERNTRSPDPWSTDWHKEQTLGRDFRVNSVLVRTGPPTGERRWKEKVWDKHNQCWLTVERREPIVPTLAVKSKSQVKAQTGRTQSRTRTYVHAQGQPGSKAQTSKSWTWNDRAAQFAPQNAGEFPTQRDAQPHLLRDPRKK